jgi:hypothetical protein
VNVGNFGTTGAIHPPFQSDKARPRLRVRAAARYCLALHPVRDRCQNSQVVCLSGFFVYI